MEMHVLFETNEEQWGADQDNILYNCYNTLVTPLFPLLEGSFHSRKSSPKKNKKRQKDAEQWYTADPKQSGFPYELGRLSMLIASNNLGRYNCLGLADTGRSLSNSFMKNIIFKNKSYNLEFRFSITGYQFPDEVSDDDGNWLNVKCGCYYKDKEFVVVDPSLLTTELLEISKWFNSISQNEIPEYVSLSFVEPNLEFILYSNINNVLRYGIKLDLETKPPFKIEEFVFDELEEEEYEFIMFFESSFEELKAYHETLKNICAEFPIHGNI